jgi:hypothetical protein
MIANRFSLFGKSVCGRCGISVKKSRFCSACRRFFGLLGDRARHSVQLMKRIERSLATGKAKSQMFAVLPLKSIQRVEKSGAKRYRSPAHP